MSEEKNAISEIIEQSTGVFEKVYEDGLQPTVKSVGNIISLPFQTLEVVLGRWQKWIINGKESIRLALEAIQEKAEKVPKDKLTEPESYIVVPAIQQLSYCYDSKELREMYANLLVSSMNFDTKLLAHPAFVEIIKQLSPDEAKLLKKISTDTSFPIIDVRINLKTGGYYNIINHFTNIADEVCQYPDNIDKYLDNLVRLGIIVISDSLMIIGKNIYEPIENHNKIVEIKNRIPPEGCSYKVVRSSFSVTAFGKDFITTCVL